MDSRDAALWTRREFLGGLTFAGAAGLLGSAPGPAAAEPPPETTRLVLLQSPSICWAPQYLAEELFRGEGFAHIEYLGTRGGEEGERLLASGRADIALGFSARHIIRVDAGDPVAMLAGLHTGCFELFAAERVRSVSALKGQSVAVTGLGSGRHVFFASMAAHVGLDSRKDVRLVLDPPAQAIRKFTDGAVDAFMAFAPEPQELRARKVGRVLVDSSVDRPWSHYFCCIVAGHREFVRRHPVATKRAIRALLKATDLCAQDPERAAQRLAARNIGKESPFTLQALREIPYGKWREFDPEDTVRFYALRLHEAGMIKSSPQRILAEGTDWRFLNELKRELKG